MSARPQRGLSGALAAFQLLALGTAISQLALVWGVLWEGGGWGFGWGWWGRRFAYIDSTQCYAQNVAAGTDICTYLVVAASVSIALSIFLLIIQCWHVHRAPIRSLALWELGVALLGVAWWVAAAVTATVYGQRADDDGVPKEAARTAVWALAWVNLGLFVLSALLSGRTGKATAPQLRPDFVAAPPAPLPQPAPGVPAYV